MRMSLNDISCACRDRPDVWMWYFRRWARSEAPYLSRIAIAQMRRATRPRTAYSASMPLEKKKEKCGAKSSTDIPRARNAST